MKNAKLLFIALIFAVIFSVGAVGAAENNFNATSSDLTQVPHEQVVSVAEPTSVQEVEAIDLETSEEENSDVTYKMELDSDDLKSTDSYEESLKEIKNSEEALLDYHSEDILGARHIIPEGYTFRDIQNAIDSAGFGDIIDLNGGTYYKDNFNTGFTPKLGVTIIGGSNGQIATLNGQDNAIYTYHRFEEMTLQNIHFTNFVASGSMMFSIVGCVLDNVNFTNLVSKNGLWAFNLNLIYTNYTNGALDNCVAPTCVINSIGTVLDSVNITNSKVTWSGMDMDNGQFTVMTDSTFKNCKFINTSSAQHAGAICMAQGKNNVIDCDFINCSAWVGGAIYAHGDFAKNEKYIIENCRFINCSAEAEGGALGISHNNMEVKNCEFINNTATKGAGIMVGGINYPDAIHGDNTHGHNITVDGCTFSQNEASIEGGAVHISGDNNTVKNSYFDDNFAVNGKGAAVYVEGSNAAIHSSNFTNHESEMGTVYIEGNNFNCTDSLFESNYASHGGAGIYVEGNDTFIDNSRFNNNNALRHGGAVHSIGDNAKILNSEFTYNNAIPSFQNQDYGLGGAIFIDGDNNEISFSTFRYNTARNGSAIYNRGEALTLNDDTFEDNQAWSYLLFTESKPHEAYWDENLETLINVTLVGGDNLINAIYNDRGVNDIYFHNVTYYINPTDLYPTGKRTTGPNEVNPVDGVENSQGGKYLYQDAREDNQVILVNVTYDGKKVFEYDGKTDMYGNVLLSIKKENLSDGEYHIGEYDVHASHPDDTVYTAIENSTKFRILPHVDVSVTKTSDKDVYFVGENAVFTIRVYGVGTNATNVRVKDILPKSLEFVSADPSQGKYYEKTNEWYVGFLPHNASQTLTLTVKTTKIGTFDNVVNVTCTERDWNLSNNVDNKTIHVDLYYTKEANVTNVSTGEYIEYSIKVYNLGSTDYTQTVRVKDTLPEGVEYANYYRLDGADLVSYSGSSDEQIWEIKNIAAQTHATITIKALAVKEGIWNNTVQVWDYPPVNASVNVSSKVDLEIIKVVSDKTPKYGDEIIWTVTVVNHGPSYAIGVYVDDVLPSGLSYVSDDSNGAYVNGKWIIGDMKKGDVAVINIRTIVNVDNATVTNVAVVNSTTPDYNESNNKDNDTITVDPACDLEIVKVVSDANPKYLDEIIWTVTVVNHGPSYATGVYVDDVLPSGLSYVSDDSNGAYVNGKWIIGDMKKGDEAVINIRTIVKVAGATVTNVAVVNSTTPDYNESNNKDNDTITVDPACDLEIIKVVSDANPKYLDEITWTVVVINHGPSDAAGVYVIDLLPNGLTYVTDDSNGAYVNGIWIIGDLEKHGDAVINIRTIVSLSNVNITNVAVVNSTTPDYDESNNKDDDTIEVDPVVDMVIEKSVDNHNPKKGDIVTWTVTVTNNGPDTAVNVVVNDVLPAGLIFVGSDGNYANNVWNVGDLAKDGSATLRIRTKVDVTAAVITNVANVTTDTPESDLTNNNDSATIDIGHEADLQVIKTVSNPAPKYGDEITWTVTVKNNGPDRAVDVIVTDILPAGLIYVSDDSNGKYNNNVWDIGTLENKASVTLKIKTKVDISNANITNVAVVSSDTHDPDDSNNEDNDTIEVDPIVDMVIDKSVDNHNPKKGDIVTWTVTVTNNGPDTALNVVVYDVLPAGLIFVDSDGNYANNVWNIGDLAKDGSATLRIRTKVDVTAVIITNVANVTTDTPESDLTNNNDSATIDIGHEADLQVIKTVSNSNPKYGDEITWTVTVKNNGPDRAVDVIVTDILPAGLIYVSDDSNGKYNNNVWNIGTLENKASVTLKIKTKVDISNANITNVAVVSSDTHDPDDSNNEDNDTIEVEPMADIEVIKIVSNPKPHNGDEITWIISVVNHGPQDAVNVIVNDNLPKGLVYVSDDGEGAYNNKTGIWHIGTLHAGKGLVLNIITRVDVSDANITNVAKATSDTYDPNETNNEDNDTIEVNPIADVIIDKSVDNHNPKKGDIITWTVTVKNNGPDTALNVVVNDVLPAGLIFVDSDGNYANNVWNVGDLAKDGHATLKIWTKVDVTAVIITNVANVTTDTPESDLTNNNDSATIDIGHEADLEVIKVVSNPNPNKGDIITWTVTVKNKGPDRAVDVIVTDILPAGLIYVSDDSNGKYNNDVWDIGTLENRASVTLKIKTKVDISNANITNVAVVSSDTHDPDDSNNEDNDTIEIPPMADIEVTKVVSNPKPNYGDEITWTITVVNHGPQDAVNVIVNDNLPKGLIYVSDDGEGAYNSGTGLWNIGVLHNGRGVVLNIISKVDISNTNITNVAVATLDTYDPNETNNKDNDTIEVPPMADLEVTKVVSNSKPHYGNEITWTISVFNNGPDNAVNVIVYDTLPEGLIYVSDDGKGAYDYATGKWDVGNLSSKEGMVLNIVSKVDAFNTVITNVANVTSDTYDPNETNNKDNDTIEPKPYTDLSAIKTSDKDEYFIGDIAVWTVTVHNAANGTDATNVCLDDIFPGDFFEIIDWTTNNGTFKKWIGNEYMWEIGFMVNGTNATLTVVTRAKAAREEITNFVNVFSDADEWNYGNNGANKSVDVVDIPNPIKTVDNPKPYYNDEVVYNLTIINTGNTVYTNNLTVVDTLPAGLDFVGVDGIIGARLISFDYETLSWVLTDIDCNAPCVITVRVKVNDLSSLTNDMTITGPDGTSKTVNCTINPVPLADLEVVKYVSNGTVHKGDSVVWTIVVTNNGPNLAENVYVNDTLPKGLIFGSADGDYNPETGIWTIGNLVSGESKSLEIKTVANITNATITNIASINSTTHDPDMGNNVANNTTSVPPEADLEIVKEVNATECVKDQIVEWTITMSNHGPDGAENVLVKDNLPNTLIFISADGDYDPYTGIWTIDYLASGDDVRVLHIITKVNTTNQVIVNNATVTSGTYDPDMSNNKASNTTTVKPSADLEIIKVVSDANPHKGDVITWTITVTNNGPDMAKDVKVTDKLPVGLVFAGANGEYDNDTGVWTVGDLSNGESKSLVITTVVDITNANITNVAVTTSTTPDSNGTNNKDNDTADVAPEADIKVIKTVSDSKPTEGDVITWTIVVANLGPDAAKEVSIEENLPAGLKLISAKGTKGSFEDGIWKIGTLDNGEIVTLVLTTEVTASKGTVENIVVATASTYDPNETNNRDEEIITPEPPVQSADLEVMKVANVENVKVGDKIIWTVTVVNHGPDAAKNVRVGDVVFGDVEYISSEASKGLFDPVNGVWTIGDMENGETAILTLEFKALSEGTVINAVKVVSDTPDPNEDNNKDDSVVTVEPNNSAPETPNAPASKAPAKMPATGNPIAIVLLALLAIAGVTLRRRN